MGVLDSLEPKSVFHFFEEICNIPHGSGNIEGISNYLVDFAKKRGLFYVQDEVKNVIISKEASPGYEDREGVILQGHMDMVAVHRPDYQIDMKTEPLKVGIDGDYLYAEGTSLGGDDGIAIAYGLAVLDDGSLPHPHIDLIITVDEEVGLNGAKAVDLSKVKGTRLLNLDSEEEGYFLAGCAGGARVRLHLPVEREERKGVLYTCKICGLSGGHSGSEIHKERGNSNCLAGRFIHTLLTTADIGLCTLKGGLADNAIPRETEVGFVVSEKEAETDQAISAFEKILQNELSTKDPGVKIETVKESGVTASCLNGASVRRAADLLLALPNGVQAMSADVEGLVQTSLNNGIMSLDEKELFITASVRSSVESEKEALLDRIKAVIRLAGGSIEVGAEYPGWEYKKDSPFRDLCVKVYEDMYGKKPVVQAIHAGVECGLLLEKRPDLDCISMGPDMKDVHTTEERLSISSTRRMWEYICRLLAEA